MLLIFTVKTVKNIDTRLEVRPIDLRRKTLQHIFNVRSLVLKSVRDYFYSQKFTEISTPKMIATATEGGAALFAIFYYNKEAFLAQSPQLYKEQLTMSFEKVFEIAPIFRAEPSRTNRHLAEAISIDLEEAFVDYNDVMNRIEEIIKIVNGLTQSYLRRSVEMRSEESEKMIGFINEQLPMMREELDTAGKALNFYRTKVGAFDLTMESATLLQRLTDVETQIFVLGIERAQLLHRLTDNHPIIVELDEKVGRLRKQVDGIESQLNMVPEKELEYVKLNRNVKVASELYMILLNKSQVLKLTKAGTRGNVLIFDEAVSGTNPIKPKKNRIIILSLLLGVITGIVISVIRKVLNKSIQDPSIIEKQLGSPVYAEIAFSEYQAEATKTAKKHFDLLAHVGGDTQVVESLRSLRTSIQFALMEAENNIVMLSSPSPGVGKSFVSANFAYLMADSGKKILLIDADMRKGHINQYFTVEKSPGLSGFLSGEFELSQVIHKSTLHEGLDVIACGIYPPNPSELLMSDAFKTLLDKLKGLYDLIIIDTPPVLAVTDAAIIGQYAATNFMVLRSGWHHLREVQVAFKRFEHNGVKIKGTIFNGIDVRKGGYGYGYGYKYGYKYYGYQYKYK